MRIRELANEFLSHKRIAVAGISRQEKSYSRSLFREMRARGFEVIPVTPYATEIDGLTTFERVIGIQPPPDGVILATSPEVTAAIVRDCAQAGVARVWMCRGAASPQAVAFCKEKGIQVIPGYCPFMFLSDMAWFHRLHGALAKAAGQI